MKESETKIIIFGSAGFLGSMMTHKLLSQFEIVSFDRGQLDLSNNDLIEKIDFRKYSCDYVIFCAAITDIESCFKQKEHSYQINVVSTKKLLQKTKEAGAIPIFFSSDYVFSYCDRPLIENDEKLPITIYGQQKLEIETFIKANFERYLIFRTSKLMSKTLQSKNILTPILKSLTSSTPIKLFEDQWLNPVFIEDVVEVVKKSVKTRLSGEFHLGTKTVYTRAELGRKIADRLGLDQQCIQPIFMKEVLFSEARPNHNLLNCEKIENALDFRFTEVLDGIDEM